METGVSRLVGAIIRLNMMKMKSWMANFCCTTWCITIPMTNKNDTTVLEKANKINVDLLKII